MLATNDTIQPRATLTPPSSQVAAEPSARWSRPAVVLLIEDQAYIATVLRLLLMDAGYDVMLVANGEAAIAAAATTRPDLILSDVTLPGCSGPAAVATIRLSYPGLPVILMTGYDTEDIAAAIPAAGPTLILAKPLAEARLLGTVRGLLARPVAVRGSHAG